MKEYLAEVDSLIGKIELALVGGQGVSYEEGLNSLSWLKLYIAKLHSDQNDLRREIKEYEDLLAKITPKR